MPGFRPRTGNVMTVSINSPHRTSRILPITAKTVSVRRDGRTLLNCLDLSIEAAGFTVIMGPNGAGKSLLLRVLANLIRPDEGQIKWSDTAASRQRAGGVAVVFQKPVLLRRSVLANLEFALAAAGVPKPSRRTRADELLAMAGLQSLSESPARVLSGGEQQRLALVRALASVPQVLLLDEPTASLDPQATRDFEQLAKSIHDSGTKIVMVTHDVGQAHRLADEVVFIHQGQIVEVAPTAHFFENASHPASKAYLEGELYV